MINLVTYLRDEEIINDNILEFYHAVLEVDETSKLIVYVSDDRNDLASDDKITIIKLSGTKYKRILHTLTIVNDDDYLISIDNDMKINDKYFKKFINEVKSNNADIGWGVIETQKAKSFVGLLVKVNKLISHYLIRPISWGMHFGISIPGQCFMMKVKAFKNKLKEMETFLDDIEIGLYIHNHRKELNIYHTLKTVGYEYPNTKFKNLFKQRKRWAHGLYTVLKNADQKDKKLIRTHLFLYNILPIINLALFITLTILCPYAGLGYILLTSIIISYRKLYMFPIALIYQFIFFIYDIEFIYYFLKGDKNYGNK